MRSRVARAALAAGLLVGACGGDARPVASVSPAALQAQHRAQEATNAVALGERDPLPTRERVMPTTRASRSSPGGRAAEGGHSRAAVRQPTTGSTGSTLTVSSTAYCETGGMANGQRTYDGAVAMNGQPIGSRWHVLSGPYAGRTLTVADRIGHGSSFDIAMPGRCQVALDYGRKRIIVERVG